jgi:hypothetical protein
MRLILATGMLCVACFLIGAKVGQTASNGERIELPKVNPLKAIREREDRKEAEREQNRIETIMRNVERYNGTSAGQEDVPRG